MTRLTPPRRLLAATGRCLGTLALAGLMASAQAAALTPVKFTLDWRFEGPSAPFLLAAQKGYFAREGLDVSIDAGNGSAGAVTRVATGAYDIGFADFNALIEYSAGNPQTPLKAVYMVYNNTPAAVFALKSSGIASPADLKGKTLAAPVFDAGRKAWPAFARHNGLATDDVTWQSVDPAIRETLLARGQVDAITGFYFTSVLNLQARGVKPEDIVSLPYPQYGVELYGNAIIASDKLLQDNPELVNGFLRAFNKALQETLADPDSAVAYVVKQDPLAKEAIELRRLKLALEANVVTDEVREIGLGAVKAERLQRAIEEAVSAYGLQSAPAADSLFDATHLPAAADRQLP
ncbi:NitT/TauT family transport system substrate-binding protein [Pseudomonas flavescens]|uniref:Thiamine pyrimidine synthase n=1 Tax=Phytopseudomonas flavescens TaxID=29435 RepID=A0A1G8H795_9GAMM|nr:ABC transporter substrate-binding protein [Pseudomonas flavescens]SDI02528.1 NitT/TauT family transport system substrate-binding protein [Pseudomonas flavescens]